MILIKNLKVKKKLVKLLEETWGNIYNSIRRGKTFLRTKQPPYYIEKEIELIHLTT